MKIKRLAVAIASTLLLMIMGISFGNAHAKSVPNMNNNYWNTYHHLYIKHAVVAEKIHCSNPMYHGYRIQYKKLHRGKKIWVINTNTNFQWRIYNKHMPSTNSDFWVVNRMNSNWLTHHKK